LTSDAPCFDNHPVASGWTVTVIRYIEMFEIHFTLFWKISHYPWQYLLTLDGYTTFGSSEADSTLEMNCNRHVDLSLFQSTLSHHLFQDDVLAQSKYGQPYMLTSMIIIFALRINKPFLSVIHSNECTKSRDLLCSMLVLGSDRLVLALRAFPRLLQSRLDIYRS